ncbi:MAG TPA: ABC transporter substrate-binding protein [Methylomirabilota bacterium]|jgi:phospholipid transport system substrate-binding protein|nr:ABC transporter substrate-binding protein [Methylomirabilota bacterium]
MPSRSLVFTLAAVALTLAVAVPAHAVDPAVHLSDHVDAVFRTLQDPALQAPEKDTERRLAVRRIVDNLFDFNETARRALGRHWSERSPAERDRFVHLFTDLIDRAYLRRVDRYDGEQVVVLGSTVQGDEATVQTKVITRDNSQIPVDYMMARTPDDRWRVWDVKIGGMSLVSSYRVQFNKIIVSESYDELVRRLEVKVSAQR